MLVRIALLVFAVSVAATVEAAAIRLPRTGQTLCWDTAGTVIDCAGTGQDGDTLTGVEWPSPRFRDNGDGTLTDLMTGLVWLRQANCFGSISWQQALNAANTLAAGACGLTDASAAGDWRLPNRKELMSITNQNVADGGAWLNSQGFVNGQHTYYWTSDTCLDYGVVYKWIVHPIGAAYPDSWNTPPGSRFVMLVRNPAEVTISGAVDAGNGIIASATPLVVPYGSAASFALSPEVGYRLDPAVSGTCHPGVFDGNTYDLGTATADCTVGFTFVPITHVISISTTGSGSLDCLPPGEVAYNEDVSCTATPTAGNHIADVTVDGAAQTVADPGSFAYSFPAVTTDHSIFAAFAVNRYLVSFVSGGNGTVTGNASQTVDYGGGTSAVTAVPDTGHHFAQWTGDNGFAPTTANPLSLTNVTANHVVTAQFATDRFTVTPGSAANGGITPSVPQSVDYNGTAGFTLAPDAGYDIASATGCGGTLNGFVYTTAPVTANCSVGFSFAPKTYTITASAGGGGAIACTSATVLYNGTVSCNVVPQTGHHIAGVTVDGTGQTVANPQAFTYVFSGVNANHALGAVFAANGYSVTPVTAGNGSVTPGSMQTVQYQGVSSFTLAPAEGYRLASVTGCGGTLAGATYTTAPVTGDCTVNVSFAPIVDTVTFASGPNGGVEGTTSQLVEYGAGTTAVRAVPATGYHFVDWTGDNGFSATVANPLTLSRVTADLALTANFAIDTYVVTVAAADHGKIAPAGPLSVNYNGTTSFAVTPDTGYRVVSVSGCGGTLNGTLYTTGPVSSDCAVAASFAPVVYGITGTCADDRGTISCTPTVNYGGSGSCTMSALPGFHLAVLSDNGTDCLARVVGNNYTVADVTVGHTVTAGYAANTYDIADAQKAFRSILGRVSLSDGERSRLDVAPLGADGRPRPNGVVDVADLVVVLRRIVGVVTW